MGTKDNGLTLEGLAQRLEELERENDKLRDEVAAVRGSGPGRDGVGGVLSTPSASRAENGSEDGEGQATEVPEARMDRRRLLKGAAAAAASLVVAGSLTQRNIREAKAVEQLYNSVSSAEPSIWGHNNDQGEGVQGTSRYGTGVVGYGWVDRVNNERIQGGHGVVGEGSGFGHGVVGNTGHHPPSDFSPEDQRVGYGAGVLGRNILISLPDSEIVGGINNQPLGVGVKGEGSLTGVEGLATREGEYGLNESGVVNSGGVGVLGRDTNANSGVGVQGESPSLGVKGTSPRIGVSGEGPSDSGATHIGVRGLSPNGIGGVFGGKRAPLMLVSNSAATGKPTGSHQTGELYVNSSVELLICTRSGNPGTWRKFQTVPA